MSETANLPTNDDRASTAKPKVHAERVGATLRLGDEDLSPTALWDFAELALNPCASLKIEIAPAAYDRIHKAANFVERVLEENRPVYGINTGFGHFAGVVILAEQMEQLQHNIVHSHCCGVGEPLPRDLVLGMWMVILNRICRGHSGVSSATTEFIVKMLEAGLLACVPSRGSVGASGDLAPGAHALRVLLGEGRCTLPERGSFLELPAGEALKRLGAKPLGLRPKEGLSLINGSHLTAALASKAWYEAKKLVATANLAAAITFEVLRGSHRIFSDMVLHAHRHRGTLACGREIAGWIDPTSEIATKHRHLNWIQDPYCLRCAPQVHGAVWEELEYSRGVLEAELNAVTDNPLLFPVEELAMSCGNFHAIYPARVSDRIASALTTLASISERRINAMMNSQRTKLPAFLVNEGGINSGFMMAQVTAAALVSECKSLSFPASVDSIPTNCDQEDHVSMGPIAGFKALQVCEKVCYVLAIELLAAAQAIDLLSPLKPARRIRESHSLIRKMVPFLDKDRALAEDIELVAARIRDGGIFPR